MKIIYTASLSKKSKILDFIVEKATGIYDKIKNVFKGDEEAEKEAAEVVREQERAEEFEKEFAQQEIQDILNQKSITTQPIEQENFEQYEPEQIAAAQSIGKDIDIGYRTFYSGVLIPKRSIRPLYTKYAETTGNYILVSWDYDMRDFRAFVIPNILPVVDIK